MWVRLEYFSPVSADWWVGHKGLDMADPHAYIRGLNARKNPPHPIVARAVDNDTGEIIYGEGGDLL